MSTKDIPELDARGLRKFAFTTAAILIALFAFLLPWLFGFSLPIWPWLIAAVLALWGALKPSTLTPVYKTWMRFGLIMSKITTPIILGIVYFLLFTPISFIMKLFGRDTLKRQLDHECETYRIASSTPRL